MELQAIVDSQVFGAYNAHVMRVRGDSFPMNSHVTRLFMLLLLVGGGGGGRGG